MGLFSSIKKAVGGLVGGITGGDVLGVAGSLAGGFMTNTSNASNVAMSNETAINLANTRHQREVADMRAAGLNPILSAGGGGAASPNISTPIVNNALGDTVSSARSSKLVQEQLKNIEADTYLKNSNWVAANALAQKTIEETKNAARTGRLLDAQLPEALATANLYGGDSGQTIKAVEKIAGAAGAVGGAANSAKNLLKLPSGKNPGMSLPMKGN